MIESEPIGARQRAKPLGHGTPDGDIFGGEVVNARMTEQRLNQVLQCLRGELEDGPFGPLWLDELAAEIRRLWRENAELRDRLCLSPANRPD